MPNRRAANLAVLDDLQDALQEGVILIERLQVTLI
jgi:hypothetical protein